jgi:hypothetical protein
METLKDVGVTIKKTSNFIEETIKDLEKSVKILRSRYNYETSPKKEKDLKIIMNDTKGVQNNEK